MGLLAAAAGTAINVIIFLCGRALGVSFLVRFSSSQPSAHVGIASVAGVSFVALGAGTVIAALVRPRLGLSVTAVQLTAAGLAVLSLAGPLAFGAGASTKLLLASMHLAAGTTFVLSLQRARPMVGNRDTGRHLPRRQG
jgi:hypothetical protein